MPEQIYLTITRSDGASVAVDGVQYGLISIDGLDTPNIEVYTTERAIGNGDLVTSKRIGKRAIDLEIGVMNLAYGDILRRALTAFFSPLYSYDLEVTRYGIARTAQNCEIETLDIPTKKLYGRVKAKISLLCPSGLFVDAAPTQTMMTYVTPMAGYPYISTSSGRILGIRSYQKSINIPNLGETDAYLFITMIAHADVEWPQVRVNAVEPAVKLRTTLTDGDMVEIDARTGSVTLNGANGWSTCHPIGNFEALKLLPGDNLVEYGGSNSDFLEVVVQHSPTRLGA